MAEPDLSEFTTEQLDAMMSGKMPIPGTEPAEPATEAPPPAAAETAAPAEEAPPPVAEPPAPEPTVEELDKQLHQAQLEQLRADLEHWQKTAGKHGGELGFLRQQNSKLAEQIDALRRQPQETGYEPEPQEQAPPKAVERTADPRDTWMVAKALQDAVSGFFATHQEAGEAKQEIHDRIQEAIKNGEFDYESLARTTDPIRATREMTDAMDEAWHSVRAIHKAKVVEELTTKRADMIRGLQEKKQQAAISASGATPMPREATKRLEDLTVDELDAELRRLTANGEPRRTR